MMNKDIEIEVLKNNVMELQKQLHDAQVRITELNEIVQKQQSQLSSYKNESL